MFEAQCPTGSTLRLHQRQMAKMSAALPVTAKWPALPKLTQSLTLQDPYHSLARGHSELHFDLCLRPNAQQDLTLRLHQRQMAKMSAALPVTAKWPALPKLTRSLTLQDPYHLL